MSDKPLGRLLSDPDLDADVREALKQAEGANIDPPLGAKEAVFSALLAGVGAGGAGGAGSAGSSGSAGSAATTGSAGATGLGTAGSLIPSILIGSACAGLVIGAYALFSPGESGPPLEQPSAQLSAPSPENSSELADNAKEAQATPPEPEAKSPEKAATASNSKESPAQLTAGNSSLLTANPPPSGGSNPMAEESKMVSEARLLLRQGNAGQALLLLDKIQRQFPRAMLYQEREALAIEALYKSGQKQMAASRAQAFVERFPKSPFSHRVAAFLK